MAAASGLLGRGMPPTPTLPLQPCGSLAAPLLIPPPGTTCLGGPLGTTQTVHPQGRPPFFLKTMFPVCVGKLENRRTCTQIMVNLTCRLLEAKRPSGRLQAVKALNPRLIFLVGVKWSCLRINQPALPPWAGGCAADHELIPHHHRHRFLRLRQYYPNP